MKARQSESLFLSVITLLPIAILPAAAATPDWLRQASRASVPQYPDNPVAVMLQNEQVTSVKSSGEVTTVYRHAYKVLRPEGRHYGVVRIYFDSETRITYLKGWSISGSGAEYEVKEKDALDTILFSENLYEDARQKVLRIPAADPGAVIGYEYEQRGRPAIRQDHWMFQQEVPVRLARMTLQLPAGWEYREFWANHPAVRPQTNTANQFTWELKDIPAIQVAPAMPAWQASAGQLRLTYLGPNGGDSMTSWDGVGRWYAQLTSGRRQPSAEVRQKALELTTGVSTVVARIQALASFVQREIRYVAIEIGVGGYQPHPARDIFQNLYGDCKDKVTLLSTMLSEIGIESYYVLINTRRGVVTPEFPSPHSFNHAILAIRAPANVPAGGFLSSLKNPQLGSLVFFDPTDPYVPFGYLPAELQASFGLVVGNFGGELMQLPLTPAAANSLDRTARLRLSAEGVLEGEIRETRSGSPASDFRGSWRNSSEVDRRKGIQALFGRQMADVKNLAVQNADTFSGDLILQYSVRLANYSAPAGPLLLFRPRVLAEWGAEVLEDKERTQPVEFPSTLVRTEAIEITLPAGFVIDELPAPAQVDIGVAAYTSKSEVEGGVLRYSRKLEVRDVVVRSDQLAELKKLYRQIAADEKSRAVLKKE